MKHLEQTLKRSLQQPLMEDSRYASSPSSRDQVKVVVLLQFDVQRFECPVPAVGQKEEAIILSEGFSFELSCHRDREYRWIIRRTLREAEELHAALRVRARSNPLITAAFSRLSFSAEASQSPGTQYSLIETYLKQICASSELCNTRDFLSFAEVSNISFSGKSEKRKEGFVWKRTGGRKASDTHCCNFAKYFRRSQLRWLVLRDDSLGYLIKPEDSKLHEYISFRGGIKADFATNRHNEDAVMVESNYRNFFFRTGDRRISLEWIREIRLAFEHSEWSRGENRFRSSFPIREGNMAKWYVDGEDYFLDVYTALKEAKSTVYITDWWLSPEMKLVRRGESQPELANLLGELVARNVKVYVHVYKEVSFALTLNSFHTKDELRNKGVKIVRHPHRSVVGHQFLWSHHEKMVIIDNRKAFLGGLDLCFGRWDTREHKLTDVDCAVWPGIDYSNCRIADFTEVENYTRDSLDRATQPRMPWHDVAMMVTGPAASDMARHFTELWNFVQTDITANYRKDKDLLQPSFPSRRSSAMRSMHDASKRADPARSQSTWRSDQMKIPLEKLKTQLEDYANVSEAILIKDLHRADRAIIAEDAEQEERVRVNLLQHSITARSFRGQQSSFARSDADEIQDETKEKREIEEDSRQGSEQLTRRMLQPENWREGNAGRFNCQMVVSRDFWSYGVDREDSIWVAYLELIGTAKYFVYIENQFFISSTAGKPVNNSIADALVFRIKYAHDNNEPFKVIVVMPLLPAFEGSVTDPSAKVLRVQLHWEYATITRGEHSIFQKLQKDDINPDDYISFYGLRTHAMMENPVTEIVYVHSKLLIVDDSVALIGSANINDRSMLGSRDSEVAVSATQMVVEDKRKLQSKLAGQDVQVSEFAHSLRMSLFREHFGDCDPEVLRDPLSESFTAFAKDRAAVTPKQTNTRIYHNLFGCYPDNSIRKIQEVNSLERTPSVEEYNQEKEQIKGFIVDFPTDFLKEENLQIPVFSPEYFIPQESFV